MLSKLGDEVKKVMQDIYDLKKKSDKLEGLPEVAKVRISGASASNSILPEKMPIVPAGEDRGQILDLLE